MLKLMRLELRRCSLRPYCAAATISCVCMTAMLFLFSVVARIENEPMFQCYSGLFLLVSVLGFAVFGVISAVMAARLIIGEYTGKRSALLFSYPVSRRAVFLAKVFVVALFTAAAALASGLVSIGLFSLLAPPLHLVDDVLTLSTVLQALANISVFSVGSACAGLIAMRVGFIRKSVPAALVTSFLIPCLLGNFLVGSGSDLLLSLTVVGIFLAVGTLLSAELSGKIEHMESL